LSFSYYRLAGNVEPYLETRPEVDIRAQPEAVKRLIALEKEAGNIKEDVDISQLADLSLVDEALRELSRGR
jgi:hypothetical protein